MEEGQAPDMIIGDHATGLSSVAGNASVPDSSDF